ncbi:MAG TPA: hypothetical protein VEM13_03880 [Gemmatimonadales bacterium]|nr:hypothetical protein [Gemmatimonadales bacterium]
MRPTRLAAALCLALACVHCKEFTSTPFTYALLNPDLDSLFVGDQSPPPTVTYYDAAGILHTPSAADVQWSSSDPTILGVNSLTGHITGVKRGAALLLATVTGIQGQGAAVIVVSDTLDLTLLLDTVYMMPGDTITVPVAVLKRNSPPPAVWFGAPSNPAFTIDSASGRLTVPGTSTAGGPFSYIVHADTTAGSIADTGAVYVTNLTDTTGGGKFFFSVLGPGITTHVGGSIRATNYARTNRNLAFQLRGTYAPSGSPSQIVQVHLPDSLVNTGSYVIDYLNPDEDFDLFSQPAAVCDPPRPWAKWEVRSPVTVVSYSRSGGALGITQLVPIANGNAISGSFSYLAQRADRYTDPLGLLAIHGTFVAPLVTDRSTCR